MNSIKLLSCILLLIVVICGATMAQSWSSAYSTGLTAVDFSKTGNEYTLVLRNLTSLIGDTEDAWDLLVWALEPFNLPAPETIIMIPDGWVWDNGHFKMFEIENPNEKYYTPPALAPGQTFTFKYTSNLLNPINVCPESGPQFMTHVAAVDPTQPGNDTVKWIGVTPDGYPGPTWYDRSFTNIPEPGALLCLACSIIGTAGIVIRRRS